MNQASSACVAAARALAGLILVVAIPSAVLAAQIKVLCAIALQGPMSDLSAQFEKSTGHKVTVAYATAGALADRIK